MSTEGKPSKRQAAVDTEQVRHQEEIDQALLKLALLKENFQYRDFFTSVKPTHTACSPTYAGREKATKPIKPE